MARLDLDRQNEFEPKRIEFAKQQIVKRGYEIKYSDNTKIQFDFKGSTVTLFPYSGWHTGRTIKDGRGLNGLLNQL